VRRIAQRGRVGIGGLLLAGVLAGPAIPVRAVPPPLTLALMDQHVKLDALAVTKDVARLLQAYQAQAPAAVIAADMTLALQADQWAQADFNGTHYQIPAALQPLASHLVAVFGTLATGIKEVATGQATMGIATLVVGSLALERVVALVMVTATLAVPTRPTPGAVAFTVPLFRQRFLHDAETLLADLNADAQAVSTNAPLTAQLDAVVRAAVADRWDQEDFNGVHYRIPPAFQAEAHTATGLFQRIGAGLLLSAQGLHKQAAAVIVPAMQQLQRMLWEIQQTP
jgi:hypothetical protein